MQILGIKSSVYTSFSKHNSNLTDKEKSLIENLVKDFPLSNINQVWVSDIKVNIKMHKNGKVKMS